METLSFTSVFPEELDSFRNVTYESEAEESKWDFEDDWDRKLEGDSENNSDNGGSNDDNDFITLRASHSMHLKICNEIFCCYPLSIYQAHIAILILLYSVM